MEGVNIGKIWHKIGKLKYVEKVRRMTEAVKKIGEKLPMALFYDRPEKSRSRAGPKRIQEEQAGATRSLQEQCLGL